MGEWRRYRKEKDGILATECIGMTCFLQRVQMYGFNLTGTKSDFFLESLFVAPAFLRQQNWIRTSFLRYYKPIGATPQRHFFGEEGGAWYDKGVTLRGLRISEKKEILRKLTVL